MCVFSTRKYLKSVIGAAGLALGMTMLTLPAEAESYGTRTGTETRPVAYYYYVSPTAYVSPAPYVSPSVYYYTTASPAYYGSPVVVMTPVMESPVVVAPVSRPSVIVAQTQLTCSEANWRRADGVMVYGVACLQPDGTWQLGR